MNQDKQTLPGLIEVFKLKWKQEISVMNTGKDKQPNVIKMARRMMPRAVILLRKIKCRTVTHRPAIRISIGARLSCILALGVMCSSCQGLTAGNSNIPVGTPADTSYAQKIWSVMEAEKMVGAQAKHLDPFIGAAKPHGWILELVYRDISVDGHTGFIVVKKNYDGSDLTVAQVKENRAQYLSSITIMYQRESGYDDDNKNWFWAKYKANGDLYSKRIGSKQVPMAGKIIKGNKGGSDGGCIYCHKSAGGGDYIFYPEIAIPPA